MRFVDFMGNNGKHSKIQAYAHKLFQTNECDGANQRMNSIIRYRCKKSITESSWMKTEHTFPNHLLVLVDNLQSHGR
jgi:hypothetical protein